MKTVFFTSHSDNNIKVFQLSLKNHETYCQRNKYDLINFKEPYNPGIDMNRVRELFKSYDRVVALGTDIFFLNDTPLEAHFNESSGIVMCPEQSRHSTPNWLNGDFIVFIKSPETYKLLDIFEETQKKEPELQRIINKIKHIHPEIHSCNTLQVAAPSLNWFINPDTKDFLSIHFHAIGRGTSPREKAHYMQRFISQKMLPF